MSGHRGAKRGHEWTPMDLSAKKKSRGYLDSHKDVEKRRRDRINNYLDTIRSLLPIYDHLPKQKRLDKADVLDMTVIYLQMVNTFLENLGVKDIFCAVHQQLSLLNASEEWIQSHRGEYSSVPSFVDAFSKHIKTEHKRAYKVIAKAINIEERSKPYLVEPSLPSGSARGCCAELPVASSVMDASRAKEHAKIKHSPFARSLSEIASSPEVTSDVTNGHIRAKEKSLEKEVNPTVATSSLHTTDASVGLVELLKRKVQPETQQQGSHGSLARPGNQEHWVSGSSIVSHPDPKYDTSFTMQSAQNLHGTMSYSRSTMPNLSNTVSQQQPSNIQQSALNQSEVAVFDCLSTSVRYGEEDPSGSQLQGKRPLPSSSHGCVAAIRRKCLCDFKVHVRDQSTNTDKTKDYNLQEKEVLLKVNAGRIEMDIGSLLRQVHATDDGCVIPITFKGSMSLNAKGSEEREDEGTKVLSCRTNPGTTADVKVEEQRKEDLTHGKACLGYNYHGQ